MKKGNLVLKLVYKHYTINLLNLSEQLVLFLYCNHYKNNTFYFQTYRLFNVKDIRVGDVSVKMLIEKIIDREEDKILKRNLRLFHKKLLSLMAERGYGMYMQKDD